jgi:hypothetical protein
LGHDDSVRSVWAAALNRAAVALAQALWVSLADSTVRLPDADRKLGGESLQGH